MWLYVVRPNIIGVPRSPADGCRNRAPTTVAMRAPASLGPPEVLDVVAPDEELLARQADPLDELAGDQHAVEGDDDVRDQRRRAAAASTSAIRCTTRGAARAAGSGSTAGPGRASATTSRPPEVEVVVGEQQDSRQSGSGSPSSSISQTRSAPRSTRPASPSWKPPAPPRVVGQLERRSAADRAGLRPRQPLPPCRRWRRCRPPGSRPSPAASPAAATSRCSRVSRLKVTTTATIRGGTRVLGRGTMRQAAPGPDRWRRQPCAVLDGSGVGLGLGPVSASDRGRRPGWRRTPRARLPREPPVVTAASRAGAAFFVFAAALRPRRGRRPRRPSRGSRSMSGCPVSIIGGTSESVEICWLAGLEGELDEAVDLARAGCRWRSSPRWRWRSSRSSHGGLRAELAGASRSSRTSGAPSASSRRSRRGRGRTTACRGRRACGCRARCSR